MAPTEPQDPKDQNSGGQADDAQDSESSASAEPEFVSMEGPDIEMPTGGTSAPDSDPEDALSAEDLSFLEDVSAGAVPAEDAQEETAEENEHLVDLKRVTAEYANYRRRTEANRQIERDRAVGEVAKLLLPVLDDLDRAEKHGDLAEGGALTTIAQKLRSSAGRIGLIAFGENGEQFDPNVHEAIFQKQNPEATVATVADVVERGYRIGDVTLRAAKVVVDTPTD